MPAQFPQALVYQFLLFQAIGLHFQEKAILAKYRRVLLSNTICLLLPSIK